MYKIIVAAAFSLAGLLIAPATASAQDSRRCSVHKEMDQQGSTLYLNPADNIPLEVGNLGTFNDNISSVHCEPGCGMVMFKKSSFQGGILLKIKYPRVYNKGPSGELFKLGKFERKLRLQDLTDPNGPLTDVSSIIVTCDK